MFVCVQDSLSAVCVILPDIHKHVQETETYILIIIFIAREAEHDIVFLVSTQIYVQHTTSTPSGIDGVG